MDPGTTPDADAASPPRVATAEALAALEALLGADRVRHDEGSRGRYARTTGIVGPAPAAIVFPTTTVEVRGVVSIAARFGVPLYPISRGRNWGYGDACAPRDGQVIVDLGCMNRILEVDRRLGYAVIEPGVTQKQLSDYLAENDTGLWVDVTGAGLEASLVGNTLDRGFGHTRHGDHFLTACGLEVVLADGRVLDTGFGHFPGATAARVYRYGVGPFLDGLFAQSNFGIVTKLGLWLMPRPEAFRAFFFVVPEDAQLADVVDRLAPLRMKGVLDSAVHIANDLRTLTARTRYPWDRTDGRTPLPPNVRRELRRAHGLGAWNGAGAIQGSKGVVRAISREIRRALGPYRVKFASDRTLSMARRTTRLLGRFGLGRGLTELLDILEPVYGLLQGRPSQEHLRGAAWRVRDPDPGEAQDPLDCHAGLLWASPVLPATGEHARAVMTLIDPIYAKHGFETLVTFTMINERAMIAITNVAFDRRQTDEAVRAAACYDALMTALIAAGYVPYRTGPAGFAKLHQHDSVFWDVTRQLKQALDPKGIIAPGRYIPD